MDREAWRLIGGFGVGLVVGIGLFYAWPQVRSNTDLIPPKIEINSVNLRRYKKNSNKLRKEEFYLKQNILAVLKYHCVAIWPAVNVQEMEIRRMGAAMSNYMFLCTAEEGQILVRVYGEGTEMFVSRNEEIEIFRRMSDLGFGPRLLGLFANGRFEEFLDVIPLSPKDLRNPETSTQIAAKTAEMHHLLKRLPGSRDNQLFERLNAWIPKARKAVSKLRVQFGAYENAAELMRVITREVEWARHTIPQIESPTVLCHNDMQYGNLLRRKKDSAIIFVDFEYSCNNFRGFDIANHFYEWCANYESSEPYILKFKLYPSVEEQMHFIEAYVNAYFGNSMSAEQLRGEAEKLRVECDHYGLLSHLHWVIWGIIQAAYSEINFNYFAYAMLRLEEYFKKKNDLYVASSRE